MSYFFGKGTDISGLNAPGSAIGRTPSPAPGPTPDQTQPFTPPPGGMKSQFSPCQQNCAQQAAQQEASGIDKETVRQNALRCLQNCPEGVPGPSPGHGQAPQPIQSQSGMVPGSPAAGAPGATPDLLRSLSVVPDEPPGPGPGPGGGPPCSGGYKAQQVKGADGRYHMLTPCKGDFTSKHGSDGMIYCCPPGGQDQCLNSADCPTGKICVDGRCADPTPRSCTTDNDCPEGQTCKDGKCVKKEDPGKMCEGGYKLSDSPVPVTTAGKIWTDKYITTAMGYTRPSEAQAHWIYKNGQFYDMIDVHKEIQGGPAAKPLGDSACKKGFKKTLSGTTEYCCPDKTTPSPDTGTFAFPPELQALYDALMGRAGEFLERKPGFSDAMLRNMFGQNFDYLRGQGAAGGAAQYENLAREGMTGTGVGQGLMQDQAWQTEGNIANVMRDIAIGNEQQKRSDITNWTDMAQKLFGTGVGFKGAEEGLNAARRAEQQGALQMMLQYLMQIMQGWA